MKCFVTLLFLCLVVCPVFADYQVFYENGKAGIRDEAGNILIPAAYEALGWSDGSFSVVNNVTGYRRASRWGLINLKKELLTKPDYENLMSGGGDRVVASRWLNPYTKKFGCLDLNGNMVVPFNYDAISIQGLRAIACVKNGARYEYGVIDLNNKTILKVAYRDIRPVGSLRFAVQDFKLKTALYSEEGVQLTGFDIDSISAFYKGFARMYQDNKVGLLDRLGDIVLPPTYRDIRISDDAQITIHAFPFWKELDARNAVIRTTLADMLIPESSGYRVTIGERYGMADSSFTTIIKPEFSYLSPFENNLAVAAKDGKRGVIRRNGEIVIPFEHDSLSIHGDLVRSMQVKFGQRCWSVYDTFGIKKTDRTYQYLGPFNGRYFPAMRNGHRGAVDRYGKELIGCVYDSLINFRYEYIALKFKGLYGIVDFQEKWIVGPQRNPISMATDGLYFEKADSILFVRDLSGQIIYFTTNSLKVVDDGFIETTQEGNLKLINWQGISVYLGTLPDGDVERIFEESEGYRGVQRDGQFGFVDNRGRLRIANRYEGIGQFKEGLAPVKLLGKWGFVDKHDEIVINPNYDQATEFDHGVSIVSRNGQWGLLSPEGKVLLPLRYDSVKRTGNKFLLYSGKNVGLAAPSGHVLIEPRFHTLQLLTNDLVLVSDGSLWGALTDDGLPVIPIMYPSLKYNEVTGHFLAMEDKGWESWKAKEVD